MHRHHRRLAVGVAIVPLALAACAAAVDSPAASAPVVGTPSVEATASPVSTESPPSVAPTPPEGIVVVPDDAASDAPPPDDGLAGMALADAASDLLMQAFEGYGLAFGPPETANGDTTYLGSREQEAVSVSIVVRDGVAHEVTLRDASGDALSGLDEMGFLIGIFAPEAQAWLIEQVESLLEDPGQPFDASSEFEHVALQIRANTAEAGDAIELVLTDR